MEKRGRLGIGLRYPYYSIYTTTQCSLHGDHSIHLISRSALSVEAEGRILVEFADGSVGGDEEGEAGLCVRRS